MAVTLAFLSEPGEEIVAIVNDGTYLYLAMQTGRIFRYTISGGALLRTFSRVDGTPTCMTLNSGTLYVGVKGGNLFSITTS
jgi:hypothetical protein